MNILPAMLIAATLGLAIFKLVIWTIILVRILQ